MSTKIILVRHGESLGNCKNTFLGQTDWDLTERGYRQAELTAEYLKDYGIDAFYASDLMRAYNTAEAVAKRYGAEVIKTEAFREIFAGEWEACPFDELNEKFAGDYHIWRNDIGNARCTGGESVRELQVRVLAEYRRIAEKHRGKTILIGTHATPIRVLKCHFLGETVEYAREIAWAPNASVTITDADDEKIILDGYADHLGEIATKFNGKV